MVKRELIDRTHLLEEIKKLQKSPWYNHRKNDNAITKALYYEREEAIEVVRDLCINNEPVITEQEILDKIRDEVLEYIDDIDIDIAVEICDIFNKYESESEE